MTPRELNVALKAYKERETNRYKLLSETIDRLLWYAGKYNSFAFNEPKNYPQKPFLFEEKQREMSDIEMENWAKNFCANYAETEVNP